MKPRILLLTPPLLQTNTPYPATMHLTGFLESKGVDVHQRDLSIKVVRDILLEYGDEMTDELLEFLGGPAPLEAKREASEVIDELAIWIRDNIDPEFGFSRYAEAKCRVVDDFGKLVKLVNRRGVIDKPLERHLKAAMDEVKPTVVGVTCPFPGTLVAAFKIAKYVKKHYPGVRLLIGGGYVNTELRDMTDKRPYKYFDDFLKSRMGKRRTKASGRRKKAEAAAQVNKGTAKAEFAKDVINGLGALVANVEVLVNGDDFPLLFRFKLTQAVIALDDGFRLYVNCLARSRLIMHNALETPFVSRYHRHDKPALAHRRLHVLIDIAVLTRPSHYALH